MWFENMTGSTVTRARADPLNLKCRNGTLELRKKFFYSNGMLEDWNAVPGTGTTGHETGCDSRRV
jgi:hypothetical protein